MVDRPGDRALIELVRRRGEALTRYAGMFTGDVAAAQDLVQDALVKVFTKTRTGRELEAMEAYVRRTIVTLYIDRYRRGRRHRKIQHLISTDQVALTGPDAAEVLDLHAALATLAPQERAAAVLRFFEDLTVPEVAVRMGLAQGSVKRYLSNAIRKLEQRLGPVDPGHDGSPIPVITTTTRREELR